MQTVAIVIPAYNAELYLSDAIASVQRQTMSDWSLTIVDDGSTDDTANIAQHYVEHDRRIILHKQSNFGLSGARNAGLHITRKSPYVLFLDADDVLEEHALKTLLDALADHWTLVAAYGLSRFVDADGTAILIGESERWSRWHRKLPSRTGMRQLADDEPTTFEALVNGNSVQSAGAMLIRRSFLDDAGPFDVSLEQCEDWDMWLRLARLGPIGFVPQVVLNYRKHDLNMSNDRTGLTASQHLVRSRAFRRARPHPELWTKVVSGFRANERYLAKSKLALVIQELRRRNGGDALRQLLYGANHLRRSLRSPPLE